MISFTVPGKPEPWRRSRTNGKRHFKDAKTRASEFRPTTNSADATESEKPSWTWDNRDIEDMYPIMSDCEWLATQNVTAIIRKGAWQDAPIMGQCEIPLNGAFSDLIDDEGSPNRRSDAAPSRSDFGRGDFDLDDDDLFSNDTSVRKTLDATMTEVIPTSELLDSKVAGSSFKSHVLHHGKYIGILTGKIAMIHINGISSEEDEAEVAEKLITLKRVLLGVRE